MPQAEGEHVSQELLCDGRVGSISTGHHNELGNVDIIISVLLLRVCNPDFGL